MQACTSAVRGQFQISRNDKHDLNHTLNSRYSEKQQTFTSTRNNELVCICVNKGPNNTTKIRINCISKIHIKSKGNLPFLRSADAIALLEAFLIISTTLSKLSSPAMTPLEPRQQPSVNKKKEISQNERASHASGHPTHFL